MSRLRESDPRGDTWEEERPRAPRRECFAPGIGPTCTNSLSRGGPVIFQPGGLTNRISGFCRVESTEIQSFARDFEPSRVFSTCLIPRHPANSDSVISIRPEWPVSDVHAMRHRPEIHSAIIKGVSVDVVDVHLGRRLRDLPMHRNQRPALLPSRTPHRVKLLAAFFCRAPFVCSEITEILVIDDCNHSPRQRDFLHTQFPNSEPTLKPCWVFPLPKPRAEEKDE